MAGQNDAIVEWEGSCLFCVSPVKLSIGIINTEPFPLYSIEDLSRYLQIDMSKVFQSGGLISPQLLAKVKKSKLKVELCSECAAISERVSELCRQMEKLEMDVIAGLQIITGKLGGIGETGEAEEPDMTAESEFSMGKLEIVKALRKETMKRGLEKLNKYVPKIHLQNLTTGAVNGKRNNIKENSDIPSDHLPDGKNHQDVEMPIDNAKVNAQSFDDDGADGRSYVGESGEESLQDGEVPIGNVKVEAQSDDDEGNSYSGHFDESSHSAVITDEDQDTTGHAVPSKSEANKNEEINNDNRTTKLETTKHGLLSLKTKYLVNAETGAHTCRNCSTEFPNYHGFYYHYQTKHLKVTFKCSVCGQTFKQLGSFNLHQKKFHGGFTYMCQLCNKGFALESNLMKHQQPNGCVAIETSTLAIVRPPGSAPKGKIQDMCSLNEESGKFKCSLCPAELSTKGSFRLHYNRVHRKVKYKCTLCETVFEVRSRYYQHLKSVHIKSPSVKYKCAVCQKEFASQQNCDGHHKSVHLGIKLKCETCGQTFTWEGGLYRHFRVSSCGKLRKPGNRTKRKNSTV